MQTDNPYNLTGAAFVRWWLNVGEKRETQKLKEEQLGMLPRHWRMDVEREFNKKLRESEKAAHDYLRQVTDPLRNLLDIAACDDDLKNLAHEMAGRCREWLGAITNKVSALEMCKRLTDGYGIAFPDWDYSGMAARVSCQVWWLRNLRNAHAKAREIAAIDAGLVHRKKNLYVSDDTMQRRREQLARNKSLLESITMQSESGCKMTLDEIAKAGMANQENRKNELMTRVAGFEEIGRQHNHIAQFITITTPSRMHAVLKEGIANPKYDGTKPDAAQKFLVQQWARCRALLAKQGIKFYGLRVAEPHHDGTPHWHMVLWCKTYGDERGIKQAIKKYFLDDVEPDEKGAQENRVKFKRVDGRGACGYVVKYVSKNLGGIDGEKSDEGNETSESAAARVEAWAATWRIRQFQQIGGHSVSVWRELRRVDEKSAAASQAIFSGWKAAQKREDRKADFARYIESMGGIDRRSRESNLALLDDWIMKRGRYGEAAARVILGVRERFGLNKVKNNREAWHRV